jgi:hypothetical protein
MVNEDLFIKFASYLTYTVTTQRSGAPLKLGTVKQFLSGVKEQLKRVSSCVAMPINVYH